MPDIKERLRELAGEALGIEKAAIKDDTILFVDHADRVGDGCAETPLGDSLERAEFMLMVEEDLDVDIPDDVASRLDTIEKAALWLEARAAADACVEQPA